MKKKTLGSFHAVLVISKEGEKKADIPNTTLAT